MSLPFTPHEAALLLNGYLEIENTGLTRYATAKKYSTILRQMAINQGKKIDGTYRSIQGITAQIAHMESAYKGRTITRPGTQLFIKIVEMYRNNQDSFNKLLEEAKCMAGFSVETKSAENIQSSNVNYNRIIPEKLLLSIRQHYGSGMRFDDTVLRLLEERSATKISKETESILRKNMFRRKDGLYFLPEMAGNKGQLAQLDKASILRKITNFGCVDIHALYSEFSNCNTETCLRNEDDLADYLTFILPKDIHIASALKTKIVKKVGTSIREALEQAVSKVVCVIKENECIMLDELLFQFPVFSEMFLHGLLEKYTDKIIPTTINDCLCYQTIESMGLDPNFSFVLNDILEELDRLSLSPSQDIVHAMLSVRLGYNLRDEFNIPDSKTFRRIISTYYTGTQPRAWKSGNFREVSGGHV